MQDWDTWLRTWALHAETRAFRERVELAVKTVQEAHSRVHKRYCGVSGGKDSVALAGILSEAGLLNDVPLVFCSTPLSTPGSDDVIDTLADAINADVFSVEPDIDVWDWLYRQPSYFDLLGEGHAEFLNKFASANLSVAWMYEHGYDGVYLGLRTQESKGRRWNRKMRGKDYRLRDGTWTCQPIVDWSARDVFAFAVSRGLPIHPYYSLALEHLMIEPEHPSSRVDCMIPADSVTQQSVLRPLQLLYPEMWARLVFVRPELKSR